jgi:hypothetical protein
MPHRIPRLVLWIVCLAVIAVPAHTLDAQSPDDWTAPYRAALLPEFVGDMAAHATAPRYATDLTIALTPETATLTGHQMVTYTNRLVETPLETLVFRLYPNLPSFGGEMVVSGVTVNGAPVEPGLDETLSILTIPLAEPLQPGAQVTVDMDFQVTLQQGRTRLYAQFSYLDDVLALPDFYPLLSIYEPGRGWWQVTDHPQGDASFSETSFYTVTITAPQELILATSGTEIDLAANADGTLTHHYVAPLMREFALFASAKFVTLTGEQDGVTVTLYFNPDKAYARASAQAGLDMTQNAVRIYDATFGRYPFTEMDVIQTPTTAGGIEYPGMFVVATNVWNKDDSFFEFVIAHEASHQWWYSLVGSDPTQNPWMDEALAQYSVAIYIRNREGEAAYVAALQAFQGQYGGYIASHDDQLIGGPVTDYPANAYFYMVYQKGPLFYAALDAAYGYTSVITMLQDYFAAYRYDIATPGDMLNSYEATLGDDLDPLFEEWVGAFPVG